MMGMEIAVREVLDPSLPFTYGDRVALLRATLPSRLAWAAAALREPPRPLALSQAEIVALEAMMSELVGTPVEVRSVVGVGRAAAVFYHHRRWGPDPVIPIAVPLMSLPIYRDAIRGLMGEQMGLDWEDYEPMKWNRRVDVAIDALLRVAPGRLRVLEVAFCLLGTAHLQSDPSGIAFLRRFQ